MGDAGMTAAELIANSSAEELADIIYQLGEEKRSRRVARAIKAAEARGELTGTRALAEVVARVRELGGTAEPVGEGPEGRHAACHDDQGVPFGISQPSPGY